MGSCPFHFTRRGFLTAAGGAIAAAGAGFGLRGIVDSTPAARIAATRAATESFWGAHQGGIITPVQAHSYFAALDLVTAKRDDVIDLLKKWTAASARMAQGLPAEDVPSDTAVVAPDSGDTAGLSPSRLTVTFGFGPGLFTKDGSDRYGLAAQRPEAFVDMPKFSGDQLVREQTGGDISIQACADDPQVAFHAVRQLVRVANYTAQVRWAQAGFVSPQPDGSTARNLLGFRDGSGNPPRDDDTAMNQFVWAGSEAPGWMRGGSYLVARRARIALEHWDQMKIGFQEQSIGRSKTTGAPLGQRNENDTVDLDAVDKDGNPYIPENSHVRLATAASNDGAKILRRSYSYNNGVNFTAERWPPWRAGMEYDAGLLFLCYQRDPRKGFIKIFDKMSKFDMMNQFVTHIGGGMFACPAGVAEGEFIGQRLFSAA